jgi:hypothetical protein
MTDPTYSLNKRTVSFSTQMPMTQSGFEPMGLPVPQPEQSTELKASMPMLKPIIKSPYQAALVAVDRRRNPAIVNGPSPGAMIHAPHLNVSPTATSILKQSLCDFVNSTSFVNLPEASVLAMLRGFIQQHEPHVNPSVYIRQEDLPSFQPDARKIPLATRTLLEQISQLEATVPLNRNSTLGEKPMIGITIYIGSPLDGEMIIANEGVVSDWLTFTRNAVKENLVQLDDGLMTSQILSRIVDVSVIPEGRHAFNIIYGAPQQCLKIGHAKFKWDSARYPCSVLSCKCSVTS